MNILLIENGREWWEALYRRLEKEGHRVDIAYDTIQVESSTRFDAYDVIVAGLAPLHRNGATLVERLRKDGVTTPILLIGARARAADRVAGLDAGADDVLTQPFAFEELLARLRALSRRRSLTQEETFLKAGPLEIDTRRREVTVHGHRWDLQPKEYALLELMVRNLGAVLTREELAEWVWGSISGTSEEAINMAVSRLRKRLREARDAGENALQIETIRGAGYRIRVKS